MPARRTVVPGERTVVSGQRTGLPGRRAVPVNGAAARGRPARTRVCLTRRGRVVVMVLVTAGLLMLAAFAWIAGADRADAARSGAPSSAVYRHLASVVVLPGQSLWGIALQADPSADPRSVIQQIVDLNALGGTSIQPGQRLWVPSG